MTSGRWIGSQAHVLCVSPARESSGRREGRCTHGVHSMCKGPVVGRTGCLGRCNQFGRPEEMVQDAVARLLGPWEDFEFYSKCSEQPGKNFRVGGRNEVAARWEEIEEDSADWCCPAVLVVALCHACESSPGPATSVPPCPRLPAPQVLWHFSPHLRCVCCSSVGP